MAYSIDLTGQVALITGAGRGIGAKTALVLATAGAQTVINDVMKPEDCAALIEEIGSVGLRPYYIPCDISNEIAVIDMLAQINRLFGRLDMLVNNAGIVADWGRSFGVNTMGVYYCTEHAREYLKKTGGRVVILTSASVFTGGTGIPAYNVTKAGAYALIMFFARNFSKDGIRVNGIAPAVIKSDMTITRFGSEENMLAHYKDIMPLGHIGTPDDVASTALFLLSPMSNMITGEVLVVDGGRMHIGGA